MRISEGARRRRRELVAKYWLQGHSSREIADLITTDRKTPTQLKSIDFKTVCKDIQFIRKEILAQSDENILQARSEAVARLRLVQKQAWEDYGNSFGIVWNQRASFLRVILDAEEKIAKLAGTMAPLQVAGPGNEPLIPQALTLLLPEGVAVRIPDGNGHKADEPIPS